MMVRRSIRVRMKHDTMRRKYNFRMKFTQVVIHLNGSRLMEKFIQWLSFSKNNKFYSRILIEF